MACDECRCSGWAQEPTFCDPTFTTCHRQHKLLHDASEAYLRDIPRPIKHSPLFEPYRALEKSVQSLIFVHFGLDPRMPECTKAADDRLLVREGIELMNERYTALGDPSHQQILEWTPEIAKDRFLIAFRKLFLTGN